MSHHHFNVEGMGKTPEGVDYLVGSGELSEGGEVFIFPRSFAVGILSAEYSETGTPVLTINLENIAHPCYSCEEIHELSSTLVVGLVPPVAKALVSILKSMWPEWESHLEEE